MRPAPPPNVDERQLELLVRIAATRCSSGFVFSSHGSLAEKDAATRRRAAQPGARINRHLQLIEPWLAGGNVVGHVQSSDAAWSAALLHVDYAHDSSMPNADCAPISRCALAGKAFVVPGVPESSQSFHLSAGRTAARAGPTRDRRHAHRVAGG